MKDDADVKALEKHIGEWSCLETVQQVFTDGYFKNRTAAGSAIFQAGEILSDAKKAIRSAREQERAACAEARERWQRLVNAIASAFTGGLVVGDDDMAVENAILAVKEVAQAIEARATESATTTEPPTMDKAIERKGGE